ncbi:MAG: hypothetical protein IID41_18475, partial [Planctomycetes bacterium]|nr:hypothetical protein [Planctomycetota bacterium]
MAGFQELVEFIQNGELVNAGIAGRATRQIDGNTRYLRDVIELILAGETIIARCKTVNSNVKPGQPVYFSTVTSQYEQGIGKVVADVSTGLLVTSESSQIWGIVLTKLNATKADILLHGIADVDMSQAIDGTIATGMYYLSNAEAGKLLPTRQPVGVAVLQLSQQGNKAGTHEVYVNTKFMDFLESHRHVKFNLVATVAGSHVPPDVGSPHKITSPNVDVEGWLPADHASFNGKAPAGARFGYNLSASTLGKLWPPIPVENAVLNACRIS